MKTHLKLQNQLQSHHLKIEPRFRSKHAVLGLLWPWVSTLISPKLCEQLHMASCVSPVSCHLREPLLLAIAAIAIVCHHSISPKINTIEDYHGLSDGCCNGLHHFSQAFPCLNGQKNGTIPHGWLRVASSWCGRQMPRASLHWSPRHLQIVWVHLVLRGHLPHTMWCFRVKIRIDRNFNGYGKL